VVSSFTDFDLQCAGVSSPANELPDMSEDEFHGPALPIPRRTLRYLRRFHRSGGALRRQRTSMAFPRRFSGIGRLH